MKIGIIGAGICGLSTGWILAKKGFDVTAFDRAESGKGAVWASAGMLAAVSETEPSEEKLLPLLLKSQSLWPSFAADLFKDSGIDVEYRTEGTLLIAQDYDDASKLKFRYEFLKSLNLNLEILSPEEALEIEPFLTHNLTMAIFSEKDHQVNSRKVALALKNAFLNNRGILKEYCPVQKVFVENNKLKYIVANGERHEFDAVILAAGAWSNQIEGLPKDSLPPVRPVKGQALAIQSDPKNPIIRHVIWGADAYMVPRNDGKIIIGATVEEKGFDSSITVGAIYNLLKAAWEMVPIVYELPIVEMWCGFRPGSRDDAPILGPTDIEGLILATGHFRNGILLAPITAYSISEYIEKKELPDIAKPFTIKRFYGK
ncbi:MAG: glycine oxidase ThiO [Thermoproteota archaeon]|jgi:glycine oxidase ThiO